MKKECYNPLKVFHHRAHIDALRRGDRPGPIHVQIIPTNVCNQRCKFCSYRCPGYSSNEMFNPRDSIPFPKLAEIVADCEEMGVLAIEITGGGEPCCHPQFHRLCETILNAEIDLGIVTNGSLWTETHATVTDRAKWIRFSVDAGCAGTYATLRQVKRDAYDCVREAIRVQHAARVPDVKQVIGVGFVVTADNWSEVVQATERACKDGADNIRISAVFQNGGAAYFDSFGMEAAKLCREAKTLEIDGFHVYDLFSDRVHDLISGRPTDPFCPLQHLTTYIGADQRVYSCCVLAYNHLGFLGSIMGRPFKEFWCDPETLQVTCSFDARKCPRCMFNAKNEMMRYALDSNPMHVNFL